MDKINSSVLRRPFFLHSKSISSIYSTRAIFSLGFRVTLGERVKGIGKWRDIKNVRSVQKRGAEGLEFWDEVSHFNAKKAYLLQAR